MSAKMALRRASKRWLMIASSQKANACAVLALYEIEKALLLTLMISRFALSPFSKLAFGSLEMLVRGCSRFIGSCIR